MKLSEPPPRAGIGEEDISENVDKYYNSSQGWGFRAATQGIEDREIYEEPI